MRHGFSPLVSLVDVSLAEAAGGRAWLGRGALAGGEQAGHQWVSAVGARRSQRSKDRPSPLVSNSHRCTRSVITGGGRNLCSKETSGLLNQK